MTTHNVAKERRHRRRKYPWVPAVVQFVDRYSTVCVVYDSYVPSMDLVTKMVSYEWVHHWLPFLGIEKTDIFPSDMKTLSLTPAWTEPPVFRWTIPPNT